MVDPTELIGAFRAEGVRLFVGVPDSLMKSFSSALTTVASPNDHVIAANEGNAIAVAMGHTLVTGEPSLVYLQNSGLGNTVNPLLSLVDPEVYGIPMVLLVGWRGEPDIPDEPQHVKQGRITPGMLDVMEIPWQELGPDATDTHATAVVQRAVGSAVDRGGPSAILVRKDAFTAHRTTESMVTLGDIRPTREQALKAVLDAIEPNAAVVATTGMLSREVFELRASAGGGDELDLLTVGGMGHASSIALGISLADPHRQVWCLDGDGALLMHLGALAVIARAAGPAFHHVVFNNRVHDSVGGQPTAIDVVDIPALARAAGYGWAHRVSTLGEVKSASIESARQGTSLLEIEVRPGNRPDIGRPTRSPTEARVRLQRALHGS
jgi:phosphonopyruvate decarboxylase